MTYHDAQTIDPLEQPIYDFITYDCEGLLGLMLVDQHLRRAAYDTPMRAWFYLVAQDRAHLRAIWDWTIARRDQWQGWGEIARESVTAFSTNLEALIKAEPLTPPAWGFALGRDPADRRRLILWEMDGQAVSPSGSGASRPSQSATGRTSGWTGTKTCWSGSRSRMSSGIRDARWPMRSSIAQWPRSAGAERKRAGTDGPAPALSMGEGRGVLMIY